MSDIITDIIVISIKTDDAFSLAECKNAYEEAGRDVDKAVEFLNEKKATDSSISAKPSGRQREIGANKAFASAFAFICVICFVLGIVSTVLAIMKIVEAFAPIAAFGLSVFGFFAFGIMNSKSKQCEKMSDEEFSAQRADEITRKKVVYLQYDNEAIVCPHCGSHDILLKEKKFSKSKAFIGATIFGLKGAVFGIPSNKRVKCCCADCGHKFEAVRR